MGDSNFTIGAKIADACLKLIRTHEHYIVNVVTKYNTLIWNGPAHDQQKEDYLRDEIYA